ncbi:hypothetical protein HG530_008196 [Fusarium avenaceum]|nr:hypothetical protein HG530_008196 [Fusarium avenaceum]
MKDRSCCLGSLIASVLIGTLPIITLKAIATDEQGQTPSQNRQTSKDTPGQCLTLGANHDTGQPSDSAEVLQNQHQSKLNVEPDLASPHTKQGLVVSIANPRHEQHADTKSQKRDLVGAEVAQLRLERLEQESLEDAAC